MPVITLTLAKIGLMVLLYLFLFWVFRVVGKEVRDTTEPEARQPRPRPRTPAAPVDRGAASTAGGRCRCATTS